ncbi:hypothetical protein [Luteolibacter soli]|uniref:PA14 domain-containing protein n=1 Tax=Luteolibacter soli TaxID=3135280 RepID=A0ABU9B0N7_9BACT
MIARITTFIVGALLTTGPARAQEETESAFGSSKKTEGSMLGIFYDLKQNQKRQPLPAGVNHLETLAAFLDSGWDENVLSRYFRATKPLYATEVLIPTMSAWGAPQAFGLEGIVQPSQWFVIYKAQVSPPEDGTYRFVGIADDVLAVGVNDKTELVSLFGAHKNYSKWKEPAPNDAIPCWAGKMKRGDWFTCKKGEIIDLDILIGEIPGSLFGAWLLIEKQGESYQTFTDPKSGQRFPILPVFQVKAKKVPVSTGDKAIPFTVNATPWICHP